MTEPSAFRDRVIRAAEAALETGGSVGPLELFQHMLLLQPVHFQAWRKGNEHFRVLEDSIQVGPKKFELALTYFAEWVRERGLKPVQADYTRRTPQGLEQLLVTANGDPDREKFYRTHYAPADLSERKSKQLSEKLAKAPDLVVFEKVSQEGNCTECGIDLPKGSYLCMENNQPLCLECADLDHLVFLPSGDTALSRRARKHSPLSAVVVRFSRSRKRYERQGLLVTTAALAQAEQQCAADAPERAVRRAQAVVYRQAADRELVTEFTQALLKLYPKCPPAEAQAIAEHTAERGSGRVGRSAAGQALDTQALELALRAHVRHVHTNYDDLLMQGTDRQHARALVRDKIERVLQAWTVISARISNRE